MDLDETLEAVSSRIMSGAAQLETEISEYQLTQLSQYIALLEKWNKAYNLTAIRDPLEMASLHILDSLAVINHLHDENIARLLDVGTGAGIPGVIIALLRPDVHCTLLDSNGKKCRFLNQAKMELRISNIEVANTRVESYSPDQPFNAVFSRAFATLKDMTDNAAHLLAKEGRFWAMKGRYPQSEIDELDNRFRLEASYELKVPNVHAERHLVELSMSQVTLD